LCRRQRMCCNRAADNTFGVRTPVQASEFLQKSKDPVEWRKHSRALRRSALALWGEFEETLLTAIRLGADNGTEPDLDEANEIFASTKLLYGLALETALKAWIIEKSPESIEIKVTMNGRGEAIHAELKSLGVSTTQGHNLLALADAAGIFAKDFSEVVKTDSDRNALRNIFRHLGEIVVWRGRYPVPLATFEPLALDPSVPAVAIEHYLRDWLDPVLDKLLARK
jgi:hypothetical protein